MSNIYIVVVDIEKAIALPLLPKAQPVRMRVKNCYILIDVTYEVHAT